MARRVLVVEDDDDLRRMYRAALTFGGFEVFEANDGMTALNFLDTERLPDLVLLDLMLPHVNGHLVYQEIVARADLRHVPVVIVTASAEAIDAPCVLRKPVTPERLVETVRRCIASGAVGVPR